MRFDGIIGVLLMAAMATNTASAQSTFARPVPPPRPVISPYLNLLRAGNSQSFNYLTLVRPELETLKSIQGLQKVIQPGAAAGAAASEGELTTGHAFGFMTHHRYFMTLGGGRSGFSTVSQPVTNRAATPRK